MNTKRFALSFVVLYILNQILGYLIHQVWLADTYASLASVWRPEAEMMSKMWIMFVTSAVFIFFFIYIFVRGYEGKGVMEGVRFGAIIGLFYSIPQAYDAYVVYPIPYYLALHWFLSGLVVCIILGAVLAMVYKPVS